MAISKQKVLVLDIETAPMTAYVWGVRDQFIANNQVVKDWYVIAWAAKWLGDPPSKMMYEDQRYKRHFSDDKSLVRKIWKLLDEADIIVTQNGKRFDARKLNARFIEHGFSPPSPYTHLDTFKISKDVAAFSFHSLEHMSTKLNVKYKKLLHAQFPGMLLWVECLKGNIRAWNEMKKYNIHDVLATEELYINLRPWTPQASPKVYIDPLNTVCTACGGRTIKQGIKPRVGGSYQRLQCTACGHWDKGKVIKDGK